MAEDVARVRVGKFEWQKLMLVSPLPFATRAVLMMLSVYMSEDGSRARPGLDNMVMVTGRSRRQIIDHLAAAVESGYLDQVERGGYRGKRYGRRASVYEATVPVDIFDVAVEVLNSPPWRRCDGPHVDSDATNEGATGRTLTVPVGREIAHRNGSEGAVSRSEGAVLRSEGAVGRTPSGSSINQKIINQSRSTSAPPPDGRRARIWSRGHIYEPNPAAPGVCLCGLPQANSVAHRRAS